MNYITACPNCATQFMLNDEHIKAYDGDVQCGNCEQIFNTKERLTELPDDIHSTSEYNARVKANKVEATKHDTAAEPTIHEALNVVLDAVPSLKDFDNTPYVGNISSMAFDEKTHKNISAPIVLEDLTVESPAFPTSTQPKSSTWWLSLAILLLLAAGLQSIYALRDKISAEYPQFKPLLVSACAALKCEINLPKNLDLLTIDGSDMQENESYQDVINFSSVIINNAYYPQALPNIELTLTDLNDKPLLKRVVSPKEYLEANTDLAAGIAALQELPIKLKINVNKLPAAGYRVLLAY